jgi:GYF domain 2
MKYYIQRGINEYGPYTLTELQRYVAQGNIVLTDLCRSEAMTEWTPVSQVLGNIPAPAPAPAIAGPVPGVGGTVYGGGAAYTPTGAYGTAAAPAMTAGPVPPDFHWALVLLIGVFSCNIFQVVWLLIEAGFVRKIRPGNNGLALIIGGMVAQLSIVFVALLAGGADQRYQGLMAGFGFLVFTAIIASVVMHIVGIFKVRAGLLEYYNTVEPINLRLSGVMTFFFSVFYFQYHFSRIAKWKRTGYLEPQ